MNSPFRLGFFRSASWGAYLLLALAAASCTNARPGPPGARAAEHLDRQGNRQGRHAIYYDDASARPQAAGRYRHGQPVGRWRYYSPLGYLERRERYQRRGFSRLTFYYPTGQVARRGRARVATEPDGLHFYWLGEWRSYSPAGVLDSIKTYEKGQLVARRPARP